MPQIRDGKSEAVLKVLRTLANKGDEAAHGFPDGVKLIDILL
jgi:hypothetical protein